MSQLFDILRSVQLGQPQVHENLAVYPVLIPNGHTRGYLTLDEALQGGSLEVKEVHEGGSVPNLAVVNNAAQPVLLVLGEELIGAKQNRVLNTSILVPAMSELTIPVSCVERGRWAYTSHRFSSGDTTAHLRLRKTQSDHVTQSLRTKKVYDANQMEVWSEVSRKISSHQTSSTTGALHDMYLQTRQQVETYLEKLSPPQSQGFLVMINQQVMGGDLFDHEETLQHLWKKLIRGYVIDAIESVKDGGSSAPDNVETQQFVEKLPTELQTEAYDSVGLGQDIRLTSPYITGSSLLWEDRFIHTTLFNSRV